MTTSLTAATFLTGWTVQNVDVSDRTKAAALALSCAADAQARGIDPDELRSAAGGDLEAFMLREIEAFMSAEPQRDLSRDD
ncbi:hypothetical protein [Terrihabitans sp. B22-R8]|uniref:hypothetical protein n=1 Tax=Terrihabitans sp. B22-R8 TaxID=3425128 RepID=UPI00403D0BA9